MGKRDLELLLAVKSGDSVKYQWLWDRLTEYADSIASALFSSPALRDEAAEKAMDKVGDWLKSDGILYIDRPWAFVRKIVSNSLIDSHKTRKLEEIGLTSARDTIERDILCEIDEGIQEAFETPDEEKSGAEGLGWRHFQIISEDRGRKEDDDRYHVHRWIEGLHELFKYEWWWNEESWRQKVESERKRAMQSLRGSDEEASLRYKECTDRLWSNYNLITARIDSIPGDSAKRVMRAYLAGFKQVEIARDFNVTPPYVSKIMNPHIKEWGWGKPDIYKARLILLTQHLAVLYRNLDKNYTQARRSKFGLGDIRMEEDSAIWQYHEKSFHNKVVSSLETKVYFGDMEKEHTASLLTTGKCFYYRWYPYQLLESTRWIMLRDTFFWSQG